MRDAICLLVSVFSIFSILQPPATAEAATLRIPGATAYLSPGPDGARVSSRRGVTGWSGQGTRVVWYGKLAGRGALTAKVRVRLDGGATSRLELAVSGQSHRATVTGSPDGPVAVDFGEFEIGDAGYHAFELTSLNQPGTPRGDIEALVLDGPAVEGAHFNLKPRRNAASVHLSYVIPDGKKKLSAFYCEMTGVDEPLWTYYMACGWHRGYFGMQINSPTERRIIFSVWDSGGEPVDRDKVAEDDRVTLVAKGDGVHTGSFGNEGTGGHSHLVFPWKTGETQRFLVTAEPVDATHTVFAGYYFRPGEGAWMLISSWKAPKEGGHLRGLYSFSENFVGKNGHLVRKARFGNQWVQSADDGSWTEIREAKFSHDPTGKADRLDRFMGVEDGQFFLSHGGFIPGFTKFGTRFERPPSGRGPSTFTLPPLPGGAPVDEGSDGDGR